MSHKGLSGGGRGGEGGGDSVRCYHSESFDEVTQRRKSDLFSFYLFIFLVKNLG